MKRNHHYISRCYQRNFADPIGTENIYCFRRSYQCWVPKSSKGIGWLRDLYTMIDEEEVETDEFEEFLHRIENETAPILWKCGENPQSISPDERYALAYFMALLISRSPPCIEFAGDVAAQAVISAFNSATPLQQRAVEERTGIIWPDHIDWNKFTVKVSKHTILAGSLHFAQLVSQQLLGLTWTFLVTNEFHPFITTDWPALVHGETTASGDHVIHGGTFPLSSTVAVLVRRDGIDGPVQAPLPDVEKMNLRSLLLAQEFVLCRGDSFPGDVHLQSWASKTAHTSTDS